MERQDFDSRRNLKRHQLKNVCSRDGRAGLYKNASKPQPLSEEDQISKENIDNTARANMNEAGGKQQHLINSTDVCEDGNEIYPECGHPNIKKLNFCEICDRIEDRNLRDHFYKIFDPDY